MHLLIPHRAIGAGGYVVPLVSCTGGGTRVLAVRLPESRAAGQLVDFEVGAGDQVRCDVYFLPLAAHAVATPSPPPSPTATDGGAL